MGSPFRVKSINLANFEYDDPHAAKVSSPRSIEACIKAGVDPADLIKKPLSLFRNPNVSDKLAQKEYRIKEKWRAKLMAHAKKEWIAIKNKEKNKKLELADFSNEIEDEKRQRIAERRKKEAAEVATNLVREYRRREKKRQLDMKMKETKRLREYKKKQHERRMIEERERQKEHNEERAHKVKESFQKHLKKKLKNAEERAAKSKARIALINEQKEAEIREKNKMARIREHEREMQRLDWAARKERIAKESLLGHQEKVERQARRLRDYQKSIQHQNQIRAERKAENLSRVQRAKEAKIAIKRKKAMEKHEMHDRRMEELQEQHEQREREKQQMLAERENHRLEILKQKEEEREKEKHDAIRRQQEKEEKLKKILQEKEEQLATKSFELKIKHEERLMQKKKHLLQEKYKRDRALSYMDEKLAKIEHLRKKRKAFSDIRKHDTIMQQESKRRIQEYIKQNHADSSIAPPEWLSSHNLLNEMKELGYNNELRIREPKSISEDAYEHLVGDSYYSRGLRTYAKEHRDLLDLNKFQSLHSPGHYKPSGRTQRIFSSTTL